jgi:hypothetical protein
MLRREHGWLSTAELKGYSTTPAKYAKRRTIVSDDSLAVSARLSET